MILGSILATVGCGMIFTFNVNSPPSQWIGYQALAGIGFGLTIQIPVIVGQAISRPTDVSSVTSLLILAQTLAGAIWIAVSQSIFDNVLLKAVPRFATGVDPKQVVATGATALRDTFSENQLPGIIRAYMEGLKDAFALGIALAGTGFLVDIIALIFNWGVLPRGEQARSVEAAVVEEQKQGHAVV